jgi:hypothetical protein
MALVDRRRVAVMLGIVALATGAPAQSPAARDAEARAVSYLAVEVPRWRREHACYSCHNNGDAARALIAASGRGHRIGDALDDTLAFLMTPERWNADTTRGGSEDLPLARVQFAAALTAMGGTGRAGTAAIDQAASLVAAHQQRDGSFRLSDTQTVGGSTFYGTALATALARNILARATAGRVREPLANADAWLRRFEPESVLDASSILIGLGRATDAAAAAQRDRALAVLKRGQGPDGGWGPYVSSQSEPFDTALAVISLSTVGDAALRPSIERARAYLVNAQNGDGSWPETTRPPGGDSYAQRVSTTAWALLALLEP